MLPGHHRLTSLVLCTTLRQLLLGTLSQNKCKPIHTSSKLTIIQPPCRLCVRL